MQSFKLYSENQNQIALTIENKNYSYGELENAVAKMIGLLQENQLEDVCLALPVAKEFSCYAFILAAYFCRNTIFYFDPIKNPLKCISQLKLVKPRKLIKLNSKNDDFLNTLHEEIPALEVLDCEAWPKSSSAELKTPTENFLLYIMSTSGSQSEPKLVPICTSSFFLMLKNLRKHLSLSKTDVFSQAFELSFDPAVAEIFLCFQIGGRLAVLHSAIRSKIFEFINEQQITVWSSVPSLVQINFTRKDLPQLPTLRLTLFTGEALIYELCKSWQKLAANSCIYNLYGPVEASVWVSLYKVSSQSFETAIRDSHMVSVGKSFESVQIEIKNSLHENCAPYCVGELHLQGAQVFTGYFEQAMRVGPYPTGDLGYYDENGNIHLTARKDFQLKVAGQRIEPNEIEELLIRHLPNSHCIVLAQTKELFNSTSGLVVASTDQNLHIEKVRESLKECVSASLIPKTICKFKDFPLTHSGKIDRKHLQELVWQVLNSDTELENV